MSECPRALSENIALLEQFGKTLTDPVTTSATPWDNRALQGDHAPTLTREQEQRTAEAFALLLATSDNKNAIGAVCIEQQSVGSGFILRTAVNSGTQDERLNTFRRLVNAARLTPRSGKLIVNKRRMIMLS